MSALRRAINARIEDEREPTAAEEVRRLHRTVIAIVLVLVIVGSFVGLFTVVNNAMDANNAAMACLYDASECR